MRMNNFGLNFLPELTWASPQSSPLILSLPTAKIFSYLYIQYEIIKITVQ